MLLDIRGKMFRDTSVTIANGKDSLLDQTNQAPEDFPRQHLCKI